MDSSTRPGPSSQRLDASSANGPLKGARILVVEDDFLISMELETILSEAGAEIAGSCRTVKNALALVEREDLAAAVLDIRIGRESIEPVARQLTRRGVPFVFYTGQVDTDAIRAEWPGCRFVAKPARPPALVKAIADLLHHP
jgi:DNA-binding NtrC family response regulator